MVMVSVSETYDLSTQIDKMGLVGIHTPFGRLIDNMYPGLVLQYKKFRFVKCDVAMACASMLPADPLQIGTEAGDIAPQDMFNPILYKAVSNDSFSNLLGYIMTQGSNVSPEDGAVNKGSIVSFNSPVFDMGLPNSDIDQFDMYYSLLADSDNWRKAMPQVGLEMRGLYPLVYQVVSNYGSNPASSQLSPSQTAVLNLGEYISDSALAYSPGSSNGSVQAIQGNVRFKGPSMRMPYIDTTYFASTDENVGDQVIETSVMYSQGASNVVSAVGQVPPCYVAMVVLPPARLSKLYYRLKVTWTIEFIGLRSLTDITSWQGMSNIGSISYGTDYDFQSEALQNHTNMVDTSGADIKKVMEGR